MIDVKQSRSMGDFPPGFEWDQVKSLKCRAARGFDFVFAAHLWDGPVDERKDARKYYSELRIQTLGRIESVFYVVVFTWRDNRRHIISARRAHSKEVLKWGK